MDTSDPWKSDLRLLSLNGPHEWRIWNLWETGARSEEATDWRCEDPEVANQLVGEGPALKSGPEKEVFASRVAGDLDDQLGSIVTLGSSHPRAPRKLRTKRQPREQAQSVRQPVRLTGHSRTLSGRTVSGFGQTSDFSEVPGTNFDGSATRARGQAGEPPSQFANPPTDLQKCLAPFRQHPFGLQTLS